MSLINRLKEKADPLSPSSKFTVLNGVLYMIIGTLFLIWPAALQILTFARDFVGDEGAMMRVIGLTLAIIGWFYFFGGRSGGKQIVAASVLDRVILVPLVLIPLAISGVFPVLLWTFAILDPVLGLVAWYLLVKENR